MSTNDLVILFANIAGVEEETRNRACDEKGDLDNSMVDILGVQLFENNFVKRGLRRRKAHSETNPRRRPFSTAFARETPRGTYESEEVVVAESRYGHHEKGRLLLPLHVTYPYEPEMLNEVLQVVDTVHTLYNCPRRKAMMNKLIDIINTFNGDIGTQFDCATGDSRINSDLSIPMKHKPFGDTTQEREIDTRMDAPVSRCLLRGCDRGVWLVIFCETGVRYSDRRINEHTTVEVVVKLMKLLPFMMLWEILLSPEVQQARSMMRKTCRGRRSVRDVDISNEVKYGRCMLVIELSEGNVDEQEWTTGKYGTNYTVQVVGRKEIQHGKRGSCYDGFSYAGYVIAFPGIRTRSCRMSVGDQVYTGQGKGLGANIGETSSSFKRRWLARVRQHVNTHHARITCEDDLPPGPRPHQDVRQGLQHRLTFAFMTKPTTRFPQPRRLSDCTDMPRGMSEPDTDGSSKNGVDDDKVDGTLTQSYRDEKANLHACFKEFLPGERLSSRRKVDLLERLFEKATPAILDRIFHILTEPEAVDTMSAANKDAVLRTRGRKRKRPTEERPIRDLLPVGPGSTTEPVSEPTVMSSEASDHVDGQHYLELPTTDQARHCFREFYSATHPSSLRTAVCAVCAREEMATPDRLSQYDVRHIPNLHRLQPQAPHEAHDIYMECVRELKKAVTEPPRHSLANNMWIGRIPWELAKLTIPEQLLIALLYPRVFVYKLYNKSWRDQDQTKLQRGMRGTVCTYELNADSVSSMLQGTLMPRPPAVLSSTIVVTFIGREKLNPSRVHSLLRVRRHVVMEALVWLKRHNKKYYGNIEIDPTRLDRLPQDGIPEEIVTTIRHNNDEELIEQESAPAFNGERDRATSE
ncbi:hypothetical protein BGW80DRAFT_1256941 [Lactifluus volemus]|nr:hypothetical protein BGW80DRAFT_1256941 [Lactifluus volemus]